MARQPTTSTTTASSTIDSAMSLTARTLGPPVPPVKADNIGTRCFSPAPTMTRYTEGEPLYIVVFNAKDGDPRFIGPFETCEAADSWAAETLDRSWVVEFVIHPWFVDDLLGSDIDRKPMILGTVLTVPASA